VKRDSQSSLSDFLNSELSKSSSTGSTANRNSRKADTSGNSIRRDNRDAKSLHAGSVPSKTLSANVNLNFSRPTATIVQHADGLLNSSATESLPAVCVIETVPFVPTSEDAMSAINVAASVLYAQYREKITGRKNYDPDDLFLYTCSVNQMHCLYNHLARAVKVANKYSPVNYAIPRMLLRAMGFQPETFIDQLSEWNMFLQTFGNKLNSIAAPDVFPLFRKQRDMYSKIYFDNNATKSQMYMYVPKTFGYFVPTIATVGSTQVTYGRMDFNELDLGLYYRSPTEALTLADVREMVNTMMHGLTRFNALGVDYALMAGDTLRVTSKYIKCTIASVSDPAPFVYDVNELQVIQNLTSVIIDDIGLKEPTPLSSDPQRRQELQTRVLLNKDDAVAGYRTWCYGKFVNSLKTNPASNDVCEWIKGSTIMTDNGTGETSNNIQTIGILYGEIHIFFYADSNYADITQSTLIDGVIVDLTSSAANVITILEGLGRLSKFDYHPMIRCEMKASGMEPYPLAFSFWDTGIWAELSPSAWKDYVQTYASVLMAL
jgi:hypothetical protein